MKGLADRRRASALVGARYYTLARHRDTRLKAAIAERLPERGAFLDAGCGWKMVLASAFRDRARLSVGMDLEPMNRIEIGLPCVIADVNAMAFASGTFDVVAMRSVSEHLAHPEIAFREIARVLRPGGAFAILCPNKWYYASIAGRLLPERAAKRVLRLIFGTSVYDNFPTYYRANTRSAIRRLAAASGLDVEVSEPCEHPPDYLKLFPRLFHLGVLWDRLTARWSPLQGLAVSYLFVLRKPAGPLGGGGAEAHGA